MTEWKHLYDGTDVVEVGLGKTYDNRRDSGQIRYIIRTYPISENLRTLQVHSQEFVFTKDLATGYDHQVTLDLMPGNYTLMVWSDLVEEGKEAYAYTAQNFAEIKPQGNYRGRQPGSRRNGHRSRSYYFRLRRSNQCPGRLWHSGDRRHYHR